MIALAITRADVANYVDALFYVYILIIFVYILLEHDVLARAADALLALVRTRS